MFDKALIAKCIGGTGVLAGAGTGGYVYWDEIKDAWNSKYETFLVQAQSAVTDIGNDYFCVESATVVAATQSNLPTDEKAEKSISCSLRQLKYEGKTYIDKEGLNDSRETFTGSTEEKALYKLRIDISKIKNLGKDLTITLKKKDSTDKKVVLKVIASLSNMKKDESFSSKKILVKAEKSYISETPQTPIACDAGTSGATTTLTCVVYKFENQPINKHTFDFTKIKKVVNLNEIQADHFYLVDFTTHTKTEELTDTNFKNLSFKKESNNIGTTFISEVFTNFDEPLTDLSKNRGFIKDIGKNHNKLLTTYLIGESEANSTDFVSTGFKCKTGASGSEKTDDNCYIVDLKDIDRTSSSIEKAETIASVANLKVAKNYFKIFVNNDILAKITKWDGTEKVTIADKSTGNTTYGSLKIVALVENGKISKGKTGTAIAHADVSISIPSGTTVDANTTYKCTVGSDADKDCDIYKINKDKVSEKEIIDQISATPEITKVSTNDDWKQGNYYFVDLKTTKAFDSSSSVEISVTLKTENKSIGTLKVTNLFANYDDIKSSDFGKLLLLPEKAKAA